MSWIYNALVGSGPQEVQVVPGSSSTPSPNSIPSVPPPSYYEAAASSSGKTGQRPAGPPPRRPLDLPALNQIRGKRIILASASPRRKQLLSHIGLDNVEVVPSTFAEDLDKATYTPWGYVLETATRKCQEVYGRVTANENAVEPALVLAADTVVVAHNGEVLEKPQNEAQHLQMLMMLRDGEPHKVYTAVVVMTPLEECQHPGYAQENCVEETVVTFDKMVTDELLKSYVRTREGVDKAGGYAIQGTGSILIEKINGPADNVIGLPLRATLKIIEKVLSNDEIEDGEEPTKI
ncbi:Maf-like protein-domain-containing protein [Geopyxis carbonaria]|nr:Maf-like protein-domain-containing protein [Geopyxis carbonaria]